LFGAVSLVFFGTKYFPEVLLISAFSSGSSKSQIIRIDYIIITDVTDVVVVQK
jgi:hypothetical protein